MRLQGWTATQPGGFSGSKEWGVLATDLRRLAAAFNTAMPNPGQQGLGSIAQARRINDAELVTAAANVEKKVDGVRTADDSALADNTNITSETRQAAIQQVDSMKKYAQALNAALSDKKEGVPEADALLQETRGIVETASKLPRVPLRRCRGRHCATT